MASGSRETAAKVRNSIDYCLAVERGNYRRARAWPAGPRSLCCCSSHFEVRERLGIETEHTIHGVALADMDPVDPTKLQGY